MFYVWAGLIEKEREELLEYLLNEYRNVYLDPKEWNTVKKDDMLHYLQLESISLLLEIMNMAVNSSVKQYTFKYFDKLEVTEVLHKLQYIMVLSKLDKVDELISYMNKIDADTKKIIPNYMKRRILKNFLIKSKKISTSKVQQLLSDYFPKHNSNNDYRNILIKRERLKNKQ